MEERARRRLLLLEKERFPFLHFFFFFRSSSIFISVCYLSCSIVRPVSLFRKKKREEREEE